MTLRRKSSANAAAPIRGRYDTLDVLRGAAALAVVIFHLKAFNLLPDVMPHAYLAVDFFFVLSGFVVSHAYADALSDGMSVAEFARRRLVRLMPLATLGALVGFVVLLVKWRLSPGREDPLINIVISGLLNLVMLPSFIAGDAYEHAMYPGDWPLWSLFFELVVNLAWSWLGVRLTLRQLVAFVAFSAACLVVIAVTHGSTRTGVDPQTFWGGLARATFGFTLGVLLWRVRRRLRLPTGPWGPAACVAALLLAFAGPLVFVHGKTGAVIWDLLWILVALPAVVAFGSAQAGSGRFGIILGELSYPIYVLHWPCLALASGLRQKLFMLVDPIVFGLLALAAVIGVAWSSFKLYDAPIRSGLG